MRRIAIMILAATALALLTAACGDDGDNGGDGVSGSTEPGPDFLLEDVEGLVRAQIQRVNNGLDSGDPAEMSDGELEEMLTAMVLQVSDLPDGLQALGGSFSTNEDAAGSLGSGVSKEQLDEWGRILGYASDYQRTSPPTGANITAVNTSISVYETAEGATDSFDDRVSRARNADWQVSYSDLEQFEQRELSPDLPVDGLYWIRISGYQQTTPAVRAFITDDQIVFRIGQAWGFVRAISTGPED